MPKTTITPNYDPTTRTRTYHVTVAHPSGSSSVYGFASREAAAEAGVRMLQDVPTEQPVCRRAFRVQGAGRMAGR